MLALRRIWGLVAAFRGATHGNVAVIFALSAVPLISFVGAAIDYSRANAARSSMQAALDSASLMLSRDLGNGTITSSQISTKAAAYVSALYTNKDAPSVSVTATYTAASGSTPASIKLDGTGSIVTDFMQVVGIPNMNIKASSTTSWGTTKLRVALALDNTGSMSSSNKIGNLKTAAKNLVTQLSGLAATSGDVYISVIPFEIDVNVGTSNVNASWLRWDLWDPKNYSNSASPWDTYCNNGYWLTMAQCQGHGWTWNHTPVTSDKTKWNGCVSDRDQSYDTTATVPSSSATNFPADQDQSCPDVPILPLTYDWTTIKNTIDSMTAQGATNQTIGLQWAWLSLLQQSPMNAPSESAGYTYQKIIVLFTDGLNTGDRWYGDFSNTSTSVDNRMKTLCDNVKAAGITLFAVQIDTDGAGQSAVLPYCASDSSKFFMLTDPGQIATAFSQIGTAISKLRVAR